MHNDATEKFDSGRERSSCSYTMKLSRFLARNKRNPLCKLEYSYYETDVKGQFIIIPI